MMRFEIRQRLSANPVRTRPYASQLRPVRYRSPFLQDRVARRSDWRLIVSCEPLPREVSRVC